MDPLRIGIAGLGTVGAGTVEVLQKHGALIAARAGREIEITAVSARSKTLDRGFSIEDFDWYDDPHIDGGSRKYRSGGRIDWRL